MTHVDLNVRSYIAIATPTWPSEVLNVWVDQTMQ